MLHKENHLKSSALLSDIVIGMSDGLTVPFALAAGLTGAVATNSIIITAGIAEIAAGSIAMGLGGFLAGQTQVDHYKSEQKREYEEIEKFPDAEKKEVMEIFEQYGFSKEAQQKVADELSKDKDKWVDFMMKYELELEKPDEKRATKSAFNIGSSYILGGLVPLLPYMFTNTPAQGLLYASIITVICLFVFGYYKSKFTGQPVWTGAFKVSFIGIIAATAAFSIARLISH
jgi:VIT1/CCC1 family predicted Fe2+/Mn2+ transporter